MKRIILHWTAGKYEPNNTDYEHYHYLVTGSGLIVKGKFQPEANDVCRTDSKGNICYAAHTGGGNTSSIGVSLCAMFGFKNSKQFGEYPVTKLQLETFFQLVAKLCKNYNIKITSDTVMTHYEFGQQNPKTTSFGKIDIIYLPPYPSVKKSQVGDFIRNKVKWYYEKLIG